MVNVSSQTPDPISSQSSLLLFVHENERPAKIYKRWDPLINQAFQIARRENFKGQSDQVCIIPADEKPFARFIFVGGGPAATFHQNQLRKSLGSTIKKLLTLPAHSLYIQLPATGTLEERAQAATEGILLGLYRFDRFKSGLPASIPFRSISLLREKSSEARAFDKGIRQGTTFAEASNFVRDMVNHPPSDMDPAAMVKIAKTVVGKSVRLKVLDKKDITKLGMGAFLGVNRGSAKPPYFLHFVYKPKGRAKKRIGICGKGITFDSGGLSLKPAKSMETMKDDMTGAATVISIMRALKVLQPQIEVHGFAAITENMPGGDAQKPGDIVKTMRGTTIEVLNTDAEGRLILSDALSYACRERLDELIDIATLTGACMIAVGPSITAIMGTGARLIGNLKSSAESVGEKIWELPLEKEYEAAIKSPIADWKNIGTPGQAGTIIGGLFLKQFVDAGLPWAHLDVASSAWSDASSALAPIGSTGIMVRTLLHYLLSIN